MVKKLVEKNPESIQFKNLNVGYGSNLIFTNFNLNLPMLGVSALVGPSGCGKSTLLKVIAGLLPPGSDFGSESGGQLIQPFKKDQIGLLFQDDELLPWETIYGNISLGLKFKKTPEKKIKTLVAEWLERIHLLGFENRYPLSLSGGQRKRVAIAQCLILEPHLLLLDEPFSSLDAIVRREIIDFIFSWIRERKLNAVLVTHDLDEAVSVADQIIILSSQAEIIQQVEVDLPTVKPSLRRADAKFNFYVKKLWAAMEKSITK